MCVCVYVCTLVQSTHVRHLPCPTHSHKVGVFGVSDGHNGVNLFNQLLFLVVLEVHVPLGQPGLASPVLDQDEPDLPVGVCV